MDIGWAVQAMKDGARIRRAVWAPMAQAYRDKAAEGLDVSGWEYVYMEQRAGHEEAVMVHWGNGLNGHFVMRDDHLTAGDWEIC